MSAETKRDAEAAMLESLTSRHRRTASTPQARLAYPLAMAPATLSVKTAEGANEFVSLAPVRRERLHETIVSQLESLVSSGHLTLGDRLPPERVLAEELGVSRNSVREAIRILESRGTLTAQQGRGVFISAPAPGGPEESPPLADRKTPVTFAQLIEVREALECQAATDAALFATPEQTDALERSLVAFECFLLGGEDAVGADAEFHSMLAEASGNPYLAFSIRRAIHESHGRRRFVIGDLSLGLSILRQHGEVYRAIRDRDPERAVQAVSDHLREVAALLASHDGEKRTESDVKRRRAPGAGRAVPGKATPGKAKLLESMRRGVVDSEVDRVQAAVEEWGARELPPLEAVWQGLVPGMRSVGRDFAAHQTFLPEALFSLEAVYSGLALLEPALESPPDDGKKLMLLGSVAGDAYGLAETFVETLSAAGGFSVVRWGETSDAQRLAETVCAREPDTIGVFPLTRSNGGLAKETLRGLQLRGLDPLLILGESRVRCASALDLVDAACSANARDALAQAILLACGLATDPEGGAESQVAAAMSRDVF